ncbi:acetyltransferase (GNAT) family protein [Streptomyces sp. CG 926]|uniref:GNAT family N-acetyltransferase n=1 Tax=Streptomyces sp. CG 926 TaxID=1882405 RepID=UPI000D6C7B2A|nr:GNAT family N-acetyltransferase [Streptomyces sp. CG 926]PWK66626.1 acetyltransferase (GNAT) family protein [Streptomyces sp. CG 926]
MAIAFTVRPARPTEAAVLQDIERAAGRCFRDIGMPEIADDEPPTLDELAAHRRAGRAWVSVGAADVPVAYLIAERVEGNLHVEQVSVHPDHARRGLGRGLLEHLAEFARRAGVPALTLTTFTEVPWNAPYYARCGFRQLDEAELTPGLRKIREREAAHGLDRWPRVCMRRDL